MQAVSQKDEQSPSNSQPTEQTQVQDIPESESIPSVPPENILSSETTGCGQRSRMPSVKLKDYVMYNAVRREETPLSSTCSSSSSSRNNPCTTPYPLSDYVTDLNFSVSHQAFLAAVTAGVEPKRYSDTIKEKVWRDSMKLEVVAHEELDTWELATLPPGKKAIASQWIHRIKYNADGTVERQKSCLVVCGNKQVAGDDYDETFAPVVKMATVCSLLSLVAEKGWEVHQMDVHNVFLHGDLEEEVYMRLPPRFSHIDPRKICRLRKAIYGLKQAPRCWFSKLSNALIEFGFIQAYSDYSLFTYAKGAKQVRVLIYVDDLVLASNDLELLTKFKTYLGDCFCMKDLGKLKYFLGIEVARSEEGIFLSQRKYALDIISDCGLLGVEPVSIPVKQNHHLAADKGPLFSDPKKYRRLVGCLVYLCVTRFELCYAIHLLSRFMKSLHVVHWEAALRVVRFLKGCPGQGPTTRQFPQTLSLC